jgi:hypothetical protein
MRRSWLLLLAFLPLFSVAQVTITGTVLNMTTTQPVAVASVFLSNTTIGNTTAADGTFTLTNIKPGKYNLIVSILGFENYVQGVIVGYKDIHLPPISLVSTAILLREAKIRPDNAWYRLYKQFKEEFLGTSQYAKGCKILNPDSLDLNYDNETRQLMAKSRGFLIIENKALGYRLKYLLVRFVKNYKQKQLVYTGYPSFEELKGSAADKRTWAANRLDCYLGSPMHFLRSVIKDKVDAEGFAVYPLIRKINSKPIIKSANNGLQADIPDKKYGLTFIDSLLQRIVYFDETEKKGIYVLDYSRDLYIMYKKRLDYRNDRAITYTQFGLPNYESTIAMFTQEPDSAGIPKDTIIVAYPKLWAFKRVLKKPYAFFDDNGVLTDPLSMTYDGYWAFMRVAELLPLDYEPPATDPKNKSTSK